MRRELIGQMRCPYCLGRFAVTRAVEEQAGKIEWGLISCRCFDFPIVDGVLLLSLAKGYGGSEEVLAPYVPLQVAAIKYLGARDVPGLRRWIGRHVPLLDRLIHSESLTYFSFSRQLALRLWPQVERDLFAWNRYEVLGRRASAGASGTINRLAGTLPGSWVMRLRRLLFPHVWSGFYMGRFVGNELAALRARLHSIRIAGPVLSLCCGHGPFELLLRGRDPTLRTVSIDGQLLNLFTVKRFIAPESDFICHDVQFALPFDDRSFAGVFSSTCLNEIPSQAHFVKESLRVAAPTGWAMFDAVTPGADNRISPTRFYRACQNQFESLNDYLKMMLECAEGRPLSLSTVGPPPFAWTKNPAFLSNAASATFLFGDNAIVHDRLDGQPAFTSSERSLLTVNPRYRVELTPEKFVGRLRTGEQWTTSLGMGAAPPIPAQVEIDRRKLKDEDYTRSVYESGALVMLPEMFASRMTSAFADGAAAS